MDKYVVERLYEALARCKNMIQEVVKESDDPTLALGQELGVSMVIDEIENIINTYL
ncbi:hypothetical protein HNQ80_004358 [Anaerosolibacter carboniphilus]|uniref:Uncharacterized protein n=1 Tax=Anaerosolibacter carboniphilus TaxID=1417629 RepID=A0A841L0V0_9FIRM|nr:hypothetical protein [Anaerosolibacter carboniphilus]MBB6218218.1 hypothetical protein [Anaerosolibacter carboniphilus]